MLSTSDGDAISMLSTSDGDAISMLSTSDDDGDDDGLGLGSSGPLALVPFVPSLLTQMHDPQARVHVNALNQVFVLKQGGRGTGSIPWHVGSLLANYFASQQLHSMENPDLSTWTWPGKVVVELGAGLGLISIVLSLLGATVIATDGEPSVVEVLAANLQANTRTHVPALVHRWGDAIDEIRGLTGPHVHAVVAADVIYGEDEAVWGTLEQSIRALCNENTLVFIGHTHRYAHTKKFLTKTLRRNFRLITKVTLQGERVCGSSGSNTVSELLVYQLIPEI